VDAAAATGRLMREALAEVRGRRPFFDSEHGPIHTFKDHRITLPEPFDDEYFRHMQWAHFASGGAGGGMRWPNREVHILTKGMHVAQQNLSRFLPIIDWRRFRRRNLHEEIAVERPELARFACGDQEQALVWLLRTDSIGRDGRLDRRASPISTRIRVPGMQPGCYEVTAWDTAIGATRTQFNVAHSGGDWLCVDTPGIVRDVALAVRKTG
jgi:mannan endo-1,4-beta-mannosidase